MRHVSPVLNDERYAGSSPANQSIALMRNTGHETRSGRSLLRTSNASATNRAPLRLPAMSSGASVLARERTIAGLQSVARGDADVRVLEVARPAHQRVARSMRSKNGRRTVRGFGRRAVERERAVGPLRVQVEHVGARAGRARSRCRRSSRPSGPRGAARAPRRGWRPRRRGTRRAGAPPRGTCCPRVTTSTRARRALGQERVGVIVGGQVVVRAVGERDACASSVCDGAREVRVEARQPLVRLERELRDDRASCAVAEERELDVLGSSPVLRDLEHHLVAALVERVAAHREARVIADVVDARARWARTRACTSRRGATVPAASRASPSAPSETTTISACGEPAQRVGREAERARKVGARVGRLDGRRAPPRARRCRRSSARAA